FHSQLAECSPGSPLALFAHVLFDLGQSEGRQVLAIPAEQLTALDPKQNYEDHRAIAKAVLAGDEDRAEEAMARHLVRTHAELAEMSLWTAPTGTPRGSNPRC